MRRHPDPRARRDTRRAKALRKSSFERLEPRLALTSTIPLESLSELSGHGGVCTCPICTGQGLELIQFEEATTGDGGGGDSDGPDRYPLSSLPQLHSNGPAAAKLFLDFNGHYEANWGSFTNVTTPVFSLDGDLTTFTDAELAAIREIWARVAEDYAPFNIDVTTVDPGNQTDKSTAVIAIGGDYSDWYGSSAGGVAYIGGFFNTSPNVGYVFEDTMFGNSRYTAEAASHEAGHLFALRHQAVWSGSTLVEPYNDGDPNWAPIMGIAYYSARSTWHNGTNNQSPTTYQDDIGILANTSNGFGLRPDDYGNTIPYAADLPVSGGSVSFGGIIERNADVDMWEFTIPTGTVSFTLNVAQFGPNLDAILELRDPASNVLFSSAPGDSFGASITASLASGTYYVVARGNGVYGNIGQYRIVGTVPEQPAVPEISVFAEGSGIGDGAWVNFGSTGVGTTVSRTFTIRNDGNATLTLAALDPAAMPAGFTLTSNLSSLSLENGQTSTFTVRFDAASEGTFQGQIQVASNDDNENPFRINLTGTASIAPEISVSDGGSGLADGDSYSFGTTTVGTSVTRTFTITNDGNTTLTLSALDGASMPIGFTLLSNLGSTSLAAGESTSFTIQLDAAAAGSYSGTIFLANNDADENPFDFTIAGTANSPSSSRPRIIDDGESGWSRVGTWTYVTGKGREDDVYRTAKGTGSKQTSWTFSGLEAGEYWVWASWSGNPNNASNAPYSIYDGNKALSTYRVDQRAGSGGFDADGTSWKYLGIVTISSGQMVVRLTNAANGYVVSDAIRTDKVFAAGALPKLAASQRSAPSAVASQPAALQHQPAGTSRTTRDALDDRAAEAALLSRVDAHFADFWHSSSAPAAAHSDLWEIDAAERPDAGKLDDALAGWEQDNASFQRG